MDISTVITLAIIVLTIGYIIIIYNGLVSLKHSVTKSLANIDVLLKQRHDELPKLVTTCQQYMKHEQETFERIVKARQSVYQAQAGHSMKALGMAETEMRLGLGSLFALAENYPELKADQSFQQLQNRISSLENGIADRRELYNESVNNNNIRIEQFPDVIVARMFNFGAFELLEFAESELKDVDMKQLFS